MTLYEFCAATHWTVSTNPIIQETNEYSVKSCRLGCYNMVQPTMLGFLSPPANGPSGLSQSTPPPGQSSPKANGKKSRDLPKRGTKKSKKCQRQERKRERKRAKLHRQCKTNVNSSTPGTPESTTPTPMPSPSDKSVPELLWDSGDIDNNASVLIADRSLTDMLCSVDKSLHHDSHSTNPESSSDTILRLEAQVLAANIELHGVKQEHTALQHQLELLMTELDKLKKNDKSQKCEIKKLLNENDRLKRDISRFKGIRKYTDNTGSTAPDKAVTAKADTAMIPAEKYNKLRSDLIEITDSLLVALDNELPADFTVVNRRKQRGPPDQGNHAHTTIQQNNALPSRSTAVMGQQMHQTPASESQQDVSSPPRPQLPQQPPSRPLPRPIPVVEIGAAARHAAQRSTNLRSPDHSDPAARRPAHPSPVTHQAATHRGDDTIVIGTSLVNGLGPKLNSLGVNATCFMYRGADIPTIQNRIRYILTPGTNPKYIILQVGGNDATKRPAASITARYESLVADIKRRCPQSTVIISKVPPRMGTMRTMSTIHEINKALDKFAERSQNVYSIDVCPTSIFHFKKDCTHFNANGLSFYADKIVTQLRNFQGPQQTLVL